MDDVSTPSPWLATRFEIRTALEPLDYLHLMNSVRWTLVERMMAWLAIVGAAGIFGGAALAATDTFAGRLPASPYWDWSLVIAVAAALAGAVLYRIFVVGPYIEAMFYGQPIGMGETTIVADAKGLDATSAGITTQLPWNKVRDVIVNDGYMFVMFGRITGLIVPRRAFADDGEAQRFAEFVRSRTPKAA